MVRKAEGALFMLVLALLAEVVSRTELVSPLYFPPVSKIAFAFFRLTESGRLPSEVLRSLIRMGCGWGLTVLLAIPLGLFLGTSPARRRLFEPLVEMLRPIPPPVIVPIAMLFLGIGDAMKIFVVFFASSFPVLTNTMDGVLAVPRTFVDTARSFGSSRAEVVWKVILPAAAPHILSGLRTSIPIALIVAILSEMVGGTDGIGRFILQMQRTFNIPEMYAGMAMLGITGYALNEAFMQLDGRLLDWHEGWRRGAGR